MLLLTATSNTGVRVWSGESRARWGKRGDESLSNARRAEVAQELCNAISDDAARRGITCLCNTAIKPQVKRTLQAAMS